MRLNSADPVTTENQPAPAAKSLESVIQESEQKISEAQNPAPKKRGRPSGSKNTSVSTSPVGAGIVSSNTAGAGLPFIPKPAGLEPYVKIAIELPVQAMRSRFSDPEIVADEETLQSLAKQGDELIGGFFPEAASNKWVALSGFGASLGLMYWTLYKDAQARRDEKEREKIVEAKNPGREIAASIFPNEVR